jgi:hypothetical protein
MGMCGATQGEGVQKTVKLRIRGRVALVESDDVDDSVFFLRSWIAVSIVSS